MKMMKVVSMLVTKIVEKVDDFWPCGVFYVFRKKGAFQAQFRHLGYLFQLHQRSRSTFRVTFFERANANPFICGKLNVYYPHLFKTSSLKMFFFVF